MIDPVKTDMDCHNCKNDFIAQLDMGLDGDYTVVCPYCGHHHCRKVRNGQVTEDRWASKTQPKDAIMACVWKCDSQPIVTSIASAYIRDRWLNREDVVL